MLHLASRSPRRAALLRLLGVEFVTIGIAVDESRLGAESAVDYVQRVAALKACAGQTAVATGTAILAADTTVSIDHQLFGKPADAASAYAMLRQLSGRWHDVYSAVVVIDGAGHQTVRVVSARVEFSCLDERAIVAYWNTGEAADKAGAYAIQGLGGALVRRIEGSYSAIVGLPLAETAELLSGAGIRHTLAP